MGKWMQHIMEPETTPEPETHIEPEDIVRLAEGRVSDKERDQWIAHVNQCGDCYEILQETLHVMAHDETATDIKERWWSRKTLYAVAASVLIAVFMGGHYYLKIQAPPQVIMASLALDGELRDMLMENDSLQWEKGDRVERLADILRSRGGGRGKIDKESGALQTLSSHKEPVRTQRDTKSPH